MDGFFGRRTLEKPEELKALGPGLLEDASKEQLLRDPVERHYFEKTHHLKFHCSKVDKDPNLVRFKHS